jgi:hypothetical protein
MANFINGYSYPVVTVKDYDTNDLIDTIYLDQCNLSGGFNEAYEEDFKRNELEKTGRYIDFDFKGARIVFSLDYSQYVKKSNLSKIEMIHMYNSNPDSYKIFLRPRADAQAREFEVRLLDGSWELGIHTGGAFSPGNKLPVIKFVTTTPVSKDFIDPDNLSIFSQYKVKF